MNVYDFDNTIYDGESMADFFRFCVRKKPSLARYAPIVFSTLAKYKLCRITLDELLVRAEKYASVFITENENIYALIDEFWSANECKIKQFYRNVQKDDDVVISASWDFLLKGICEKIGIHKLIASEIDPETGKIHFLCYHKNKVDIFLRTYPDVEIDNFYTDSYSDLPMMKMARNAYLVKGDKITKINPQEVKK